MKFMRRGRGGGMGMGMVDGDERINAHVLTSHSLRIGKGKGGVKRKKKISCTSNATPHHATSAILL